MAQYKLKEEKRQKCHMRSKVVEQQKEKSPNKCYYSNIGLETDIIISKTKSEKVTEHILH